MHILTQALLINQNQEPIRSTWLHNLQDESGPLRLSRGKVLLMWFNGSIQYKHYDYELWFKNYRCLYKVQFYIKIISCVHRGYYTATRRYEFYFRVEKTIFYERAQRMSKILFLTRENTIHMFKPPCNFLFIIWTNLSLAIFHRLFAQTTVKEREMTSSISSLVRIWKIRHSGPGCSFV